MKKEHLRELALQCGAGKAVFLEAENIVLSESFRTICAGNGCGVYGRCWMCPPDAGEIGELMARVRSFDKVLWYQKVYPLEDSYDFEGMQDAKKDFAHLVLKLRHTVRKEAPEEEAAMLFLSAGGCGICEKCTRPEGIPCRFPQDAMTSLEACGIDVYQTTAQTDLKYINGPDTVTYFAAVLLKNAQITEE